MNYVRCALHFEYHTLKDSVLQTKIVAKLAKLPQNMREVFRRGAQELRTEYRIDAAYLATIVDIGAFRSQLQQCIEAIEEEKKRDNAETNDTE